MNLFSLTPSLKPLALGTPQSSDSPCWHAPPASVRQDTAGRTDAGRAARLQPLARFALGTLIAHGFAIRSDFAEHQSGSWIAFGIKLLTPTAGTAKSTRRYVRSSSPSALAGHAEAVPTGISTTRQFASAVTRDLPVPPDRAVRPNPTASRRCIDILWDQPNPPGCSQGAHRR